MTRNVEPQGDPWYGRKDETFVLCGCGACLFDGDFHEGFYDAETRAVEAWNRRSLPADQKEWGGVPDGLLGTGSAAGHTTNEFSNLSTQAHGYGVAPCAAPSSDGDAEMIFQEAYRWSMGIVDDESFRAYLGEYLSGLRELAVVGVTEAPAPAPDEALESLIEESGGYWKEDVFCIAGGDLISLLRAASAANGVTGTGQQTVSQSFAATPSKDGVPREGME